MTRRSYPWREIADMARSTPGVWRQHRSLIAVNEHLRRHIRRRVRELQPDEGGRFRYRVGHRGIDALGREVFDLRIQYHPKEHDEQRTAQGTEEGRDQVRAGAEAPDDEVPLEGGGA